ncbi:MAG: response regulator [Pseudomonadota bacterium]
MLERCKRVAVVDDDPQMIRALRRSLSGQGADWDFSFFQDPLELLEAAKRQGFDVVVSDMRMPQMSGLELLEKIRAFSAAYGIILTGSPDLTSALFAINHAEVFRFYTKPCDHNLLIQGIKDAIAAGVDTDPPNDEPLAANDDDRLVSQLGSAALNQLSLGVVVTDREGSVQFMNKSAAALLAERDGLFICTRNRCRASTPQETQSLHEHIGNVIDHRATDHDTRALSIIRPSMKRSYTMFVAPLTERQDQTSGGKMAVLFISDPETQSMPTIDNLVVLYGLSRSQAKIVHGLALGLRLEEAADEAGVTTSTARTYLKQAFAKTGTTRQSELIKLVLASPRIAAA